MSNYMSDYSIVDAWRRNINERYNTPKSLYNFYLKETYMDIDFYTSSILSLHIYYSRYL